jgi:hypothetical protein
MASDRIGERYDSDGRSNGPLGFPMGGVRLTASGAQQPFSGGIIQELAGKLDPVVVFRAHVRFLGFRCNEESDNDQFTSSDEPYFVISVSGLKGNTTRLYGPFEDVDGGESRFVTADDDVLATDVQPPFTLSVMVLEHDHGSPEEAADKVKKSAEDAVRVTQALALAFGQAEVAVATIAVNTVLTSVGGFLSDAAAEVLDLDDDFVGSGSVRIGDWNDGELEWKTPVRLVEDPPFSSSPYNVKIDVGDDDEGRYSLYFNVNMFKVTMVPV